MACFKASVPSIITGLEHMPTMLMKKQEFQMFKFVLIVSLIILTTVSCTKETTDDAFTRIVDVNGHNMFISCVGQGEPTVILESGIGNGGSFAGWDDVQNNIKEFARVCFYDRAGLGRSALGPEPRDSKQIVMELHTLLNNVGLQPPYILTGHSLGGLHIQVFAEQYSTEIAGMVLIDPTPKELVAPLTPEQMTNLVSAGAPAGVLAEAGPGINNSIPQWQALGRLPDVPVVVLTSSPPRSTTEGSVSLENWQTLRDLHQALADEVSDGTHIIATRAGHNIQIDEPDLVINAIQGVFDKVTQSYGMMYQH